MTPVLNQTSQRLAIVLTTLALIGCGKKEVAEPDLTPISGTIKLDGQPLANADLVFHFKGTAPDGYNGAASRSDEDGVFQIKSGEKLGILPGIHRVTVTIAESAEQRQVPKKYTTAETTNLELQANADRSTGYVLELSSANE